MADQPKPLAQFFGVLPPVEEESAVGVMTWRGEFASAPPSPQLNDAYHDTTQKKAFAWDGVQWQVVAVDGRTGAQGIQGPQGIQGIQGVQGPAGTPAGPVATGHVDVVVPFTTTSATLVDIVGLTTTVTLLNTAKILCIMTGNFATTGAGTATTIAAAFSIDGVDTDEQHIDFTVSDSDQSLALHHITATLPPGSYVIKGRMRRVLGTQTAQFTDGMMSGVSLYQSA